MNLCKDCVHCVVPKSERISPVCTYHIDVVTGDKAKESCYAERARGSVFEEKCGPSGNFFEAKP